MNNSLILPTMPYGPCSEERGWRYTETTQLTTPLLGGVAVRWRWNFSKIQND